MLFNYRRKHSASGPAAPAAPSMCLLISSLSFPGLSLSAAPARENASLHVYCWVLERTGFRYIDRLILPLLRFFFFILLEIGSKET